MPITRTFGPDAGVLGALALLVGQSAPRPEFIPKSTSHIVRPRSTQREKKFRHKGKLLTLDQIEQQSRIELLQSEVSNTGRGESIDEDDPFRTRQENLTGQRTVEGDRIRQANNLSDPEKKTAIQLRSQQERVDPDQFLSQEDKQQAFEDNFDQNHVVRDGMAWTQNPKTGDWKSHDLPDQQDSFSDSDIRRARKEVRNNEQAIFDVKHFDDTDPPEFVLSEEKEALLADQFLQREANINQMIRGGTVAPVEQSQTRGQQVGFAQGTNTGAGVQFVDAAQELASQFRQAEEREVITGTSPVEQFIDQANAPEGSIFNARNAPGARAQTKAPLTEFEETQSRLVADAQRKELNNQVEARQKEFIKQLEESDDPELKKLAKELKKKESPALAVLRSALFDAAL